MFYQQNFRRFAEEKQQQAGHENTRQKRKIASLK
jgi:hypothetical protein